jgi:hypothetical protein
MPRLHRMLRTKEKFSWTRNDLFSSVDSGELSASFFATTFAAGTATIAAAADPADRGRPTDGGIRATRLVVPSLLHPSSR